MKTLMAWLGLFGLFMLLLVAGAGCASSHYSEESYHQPQVLQEYIQEHPDFYQEWQNQIPGG